MKRIAHLLQTVAANDPLPLKVAPIVRDVAYSAGIALAAAVVLGRLMFVEVHLLNTVLVSTLGFPALLALHRWIDGIEAAQRERVPAESSEYDTPAIWRRGPPAPRFPAASVGETIRLSHGDIPECEPAPALWETVDDVAVLR